jgi:hypothetical protein
VRVQFLFAESLGDELGFCKRSVGGFNLQSRWRRRARDFNNVVYNQGRK